MDETLKNTMLFDFFGDMLTEKQHEYYDLYHNEDLSLSEIAESAGISKQGVYDIIMRAEKTLVRFEKKTGIFQKWFETRSILEQSITNGEKVHPAVLSYFQLEKNT
ncbi:MAG: DNA-binding protein [Oscillospiraceae bacterium]|nr:DNA-binding protein [Oscillospiraceae bacterium]